MAEITKQQLAAAIYGQESGSGTADTTSVNSSNVTGPMQVQEATFQSLKDKGLIPKTAQWKVPADNKAAGEALVGHLFDKYDGDPGKVAAAYYAGEKAVRADGTIANFKDLKNPNNPDTYQYRDQILARLGAVPSAVGAGTASVTAARADVRDFTNVMPEHERRGAQAKTTTAPVIVGPNDIDSSGVKPLDVALGENTTALQAEQARVDSISFLDKSKLAFINNTFAGATIRKSAMNQWLDGQTPAPGFQPDPKALGGYSEDEQEFLKTAVNPAHFDRIKSEIADHRSDMADINASGTGVGIAASLFAGLPEGYLLGLGVAKGFQIAKIGSAAYAMEGRKGAALASSLAENIGGNAALTAAQSRIDPYVGTADYAMAVGGGALGTALHIKGLFREADRAVALKSFNKMMEESAQQTHNLREQAVKNLGTDASPEALIAEVQRLESNAIRRTTNQGVGEVPSNRRLLPDDDALRHDMPEAPEKTAANDAASKEPSPAAAASGWESISSGPELQKFKTENPNFFHEDGSVRTRRWMAENDPKWQENMRAGGGEGMDLRMADKLPEGVHVRPELSETPHAIPSIRAAEEIARKFLPKGSKIILGAIDHTNSAIADQATKAGVTGKAPGGLAISIGNTHFIGLNTRDVKNPGDMLKTTIHEIGHAIFHETSQQIPPGLLARMVDEHGQFLKEVREGNAAARFKRSHEGSSNVLDEHGNIKSEPIKPNSYTNSFDEYTAEAFVRHIQRKVREGDESLNIGKGAIALLKSAWERVKAVYDYAMGKGWLPKDEAFGDYFDAVQRGTLRDADRVPLPETEYLDAGIQFPASFSQMSPANAAAIVADPAAARHGLENIPVRTITEQAEAKAVLSLYKKADAAGGYKVDEKRLSKLLETSAFQGAQSTANTMMRSANPVVRMVAAELLENASGAGGRRSSAAIAKHLNEQAYLGNTLNDFQARYREFRNSQGGTIVGDFFDGKTWHQFNRLVAEEIESRRPGATPVTSPPAVKQAADHLAEGYERMRKAQTDSKTIGWASLPATSDGYMPHRMSAEKFRQISPEQENVLHGALRDQFMGIEGFDPTFSQGLASKYIDRVRRRALGGFEAPMGIHQVGAADVVEDALNQMGMGREEITAMMKKYMAGGAGHTKRRLQLDLGQEHMMPDGTSFKLMDLFETDQFKLLRGQASRVSGEVALAQHGVMGKAGLKLLRRAMEFGGAGEKTTAREIAAFDQTAAEFLGDPFGTQSKFVDRVMQANSLSRLGGMGFTQFAENINGIFHVGALKTLESITSLPRLRAEIKALARGEKVDNPIIGSLEAFRGAEFGTEAYKTVFPFDNQSLEYHTYGQDTVNAADRLLRGGQFVQGKLSMWRSIHSTQQRGFAEQIVRKAAGFLKDGTNDVALRDMGITDELMGKLRQDLGNIAEFQGNRLTNFDITKATDTKAADEFVQAIHRGVSQIIQGNFIGERGAWAHDGVMRLMTQFRTFSLTSIEKQWARQVGNVGTSKALGMVLGSMSLAAPIYMARTYLASIGRKDQAAYLENQLSAVQIARASLNYIAAAGLAGDLMDATTAVTGMGKATGGRTASASNFVGNVVAPAAGLADDLWKGVQNTKEGTDPHDLVKSLPFSRLPFLIPALNALTSK